MTNCYVQWSKSLKASISIQPDSDGFKRQRKTEHEDQVWTMKCPQSREEHDTQPHSAWLSVISGDRDSSRKDSFVGSGLVKLSMSYCSTHLVPKTAFARHKWVSHRPLRPAMYGDVHGDLEKPSTIILMAHAGCLGLLLGEAGKASTGIIQRTKNPRFIESSFEHSPGINTQCCESVDTHDRRHRHLTF